LRSKRQGTQDRHGRDNPSIALRQVVRQGCNQQHPNASMAKRGLWAMKVLLIWAARMDKSAFLKAPQYTSWVLSIRTSRIPPSPLQRLDHPSCLVRHQAAVTEQRRWVSLITPP
jgi:hypothetical protein